MIIGSTKNIILKIYFTDYKQIKKSTSNKNEWMILIFFLPTILLKWFSILRLKWDSTENEKYGMMIKGKQNMNVVFQLYKIYPSIFHISKISYYD